MIKAHAKINISLDILNKRSDGYHEVKMIMQTLELHDEIELIKASRGISVKTNLPYLPTDGLNLAYKAAQLYFSNAGITTGLDIIINKKIPVGAGLAGGSTDCAAVLNALNEVHAAFSLNELLKMGQTLGADVPYCILGGSYLAEGIGEKLSPLPPFPSCTVVLAKPPFGVSTKRVYENLDQKAILVHPDTAGIIDAMKADDLQKIAVRMFNVMEESVSSKHGIINDIKNEMLSCGALGSSMSGSGPTVFGLFNSLQKAQTAAINLKRYTNEVFVTTIKEG